MSNPMKPLNTNPGGGSASDADKNKAGGKLPAGSSKAARARNGARVANAAAKNAQPGGKHGGKGGK